MTFSMLEINDDAQMIENISDDQTKKYVYLSRALPIENIVFSGGGAKGVVYPGVIQALEGQPIKRVAGSSIGAVTAALYASGMSGFTFEELTLKQDFEALLGSLNVHLKKTGQPLLDFLRVNIADSILNTLRSANSSQLSMYYQSMNDNDKKAIHKMLGDPEQKKTFQDLLDQIKNPEYKITQPITFSMLDALRHFNGVAGIDGAFKDLSMTATNKDEPGDAPYIFNAENTPDLEVALAARASASLPVILEPVKIDSASLGIYGTDGKDKSFVDGGFLDNIPVSAVDDKKDEKEKKAASNMYRGEQGQNLQTLVFVFDETTERPYPKGQQSPYLSANEFKSRDDLYVPGLKDIVLRNIIPKIPLIGGIKTKTKNTVAKARGLKKINTDFTQRNVPLIVEGISSTSFDLAKDKADDLIATSKAATSNYLINHYDEAIYLTFDSPVAMLLAIPIQNLRTLIDDKKNVYGLTTTDLKNIEKFRMDVDGLLKKTGKHVSALSMLSDLSSYLIAGATLHPSSLTSYSDYMVDQLHANKTIWNEIIKNKNHLPSINGDLMNAINKRDALDQFEARKYELARWLDGEIANSVNEANSALLTKAREQVINAGNFAGLSDALEPVKDHYQGVEKKITMLSLMKKPPVVAKAEKYIVSLGKERLVHDPYLVEAKQAPAIKLDETSASAEEHSDKTVAVKNIAKEILPPLTEMKGHLDGYVNEYGKGVKGLYTKLLSKVKSDSLRVKKLEFARRYSDHIDTVLSQAKQQGMNGEQLSHASSSLVGMFRKDHEAVYKGNEDDKKSTTCPFKQCIDKVDDPLKKLEQSLQQETSRPSFR